MSRTVMNSMCAVLFVFGAASALHDQYHKPAAAYAFQSARGNSYPVPALQSVQAYTVPVQVYRASSTPAPQFYAASVSSAPQVYTATVATAPQVYATVTPPSQYPVHNVQVQTYSAPQYSQPENTYSAQQYSAPVNTYSAPKYTAPVVKSYSSVPKYSYAPPHHAVKSYAPTVKYQAPVVTQYSSPAYNSQYRKPVAILRHSQDDNFDGSFTYDFQAENGISSQASGYVKAVSPKEQAQVIQGQYSYTAPDGTPIVTRWYADETGFHAEGAHLPVAPPVPEAIAKSLAYQGSPQVIAY